MSLRVFKEAVEKKKFETWLKSGAPPPAAVPLSVPQGSTARAKTVTVAYFSDSLSEPLKATLSSVLLNI